MSLFHALILGLVQGVTEYIPVSSSAHLVLVPWLLGWPVPPFTFDVLVQWGTLVGVFVYFWGDLWGIVRAVLLGLAHRRPFETPEARMGWYIVLGTLPATAFGLFLKDFFESAFGAPTYVAALLVGTAIILVIAERFGRRERTTADFGWLDALLVGFWQVVALLPGISRSGSTIGGAMLRGLDRHSAARFSFLLSVPAMLGAGLIAILDLLKSDSLAADLPALGIGFVAAAVSGYLCIRWLLGYLQRRGLIVFAVYCALFGLFCLAATPPAAQAAESLNRSSPVGQVLDLPHLPATSGQGPDLRRVSGDAPAFVLLRRSHLQPPQGQEGDVLVAADPAADELARQVAAVLSDPAGYPHFALRLHRYVKSYLTHQPGLLSEAATALNEATYLFISDRQGGFPAKGFWLEQPDGTLRDMRGVDFVDMQFNLDDLSGSDFGDFAQIFPHELGHILMRELAGQPERQVSHAVHFVTVRTDPWVAFAEGWGEHFQAAALDHSPAAQARRAEPLPSIKASWYARFAREQTNGCYFCPANLSFLFWQGQGEQQLRDGAVRGNGFIYTLALPPELADGRRAPYETMLYQDVIPPTPGAPLKNGAQMLASEGVMATLFYRLAGDARLQAVYREPGFYEPFLPPGQPADWTQVRPEDLFTPEENVYLKLFDVFAHSITWEVGRGSSPMLQVIAGYAERFPDEAGIVYEITLDVTRGVTVDAAAFARRGQSTYLAELQQRLLRGESRLDGALGPPLWLSNLDYQGGYGVFRYFPLHPPYNFDLNAADAADLRSVPGVSAGLAERIVAARERLGHFDGVNDLAGIEGMTPELLARFEAMHVRLEAELSSAQPMEDSPATVSLMLILLAGSYALAAVFQVGRLLALAGLVYGAALGAASLGMRSGATASSLSAVFRHDLRAVAQGLGVAALAFLVSLAFYLAGATITPPLMGLAGLSVWAALTLLRRVLNRSARPSACRLAGELTAWLGAFAVVGLMYG